MDTGLPLASHKSPTHAMGCRYVQSKQNLARNVAVSLPSFHASLTPRARLISLPWCLSACFAADGGISGS
jgi:acetate kinase